MTTEGKIKRTKHVMAIEEYNKYINPQLYIFNKHFRWVLFRCQYSEVGSLICIIIGINRHCYCRVEITFIYLFFSLENFSIISFKQNQSISLTSKATSDWFSLWQNEVVEVYRSAKWSISLQRKIDFQVMLDIIAIIKQDALNIGWNIIIGVETIINYFGVI